VAAGAGAGAGAVAVAELEDPTLVGSSHLALRILGILLLMEMMSEKEG